jgi:hypothetical protein
MPAGLYPIQKVAEMTTDIARLSKPENSSACNHPLRRLVEFLPLSCLNSIHDAVPLLFVAFSLQCNVSLARRLEKLSTYGFPENPDQSFLKGAVHLQDREPAMAAILASRSFRRSNSPSRSDSHRSRSEAH